MRHLADCLWVSHGTPCRCPAPASVQYIDPIKVMQDAQVPKRWLNHEFGGIKVNYDVVFAFANKHRLPYNEVAAMIREAMS